MNPQYTPTWPKELQELVTALYNKGYTLDQIGAKVGKSSHAISNCNTRLTRQGLIPMYRKSNGTVRQYSKTFTKEVCATILQRYLDGETIDEIAYDLGLKASTIHSHNSKLYRNGFPSIFTKAHGEISRSKRESIKAPREVPPNWCEKVTPLQKAQGYFQKRLVVSERFGYLLDGKAITIQEVLKKANALPN